MPDQPGALIHETSTTTGTGNFTLTSTNGKQTFNQHHGIGGTDKFTYYISNRDAAEWEWGTGHLSDATTLVRDTVIESSNADAAVNFSAGTKDVTNDVGANTVVETNTAQTISGVKTFSAAPVLPADTVDAITEIASGIKSGSDATLITGTAGTDQNLIEWDANGDAIDSGIAAGDVVTPSSTDTFTNKTFDANGTGNSLSNVDMANDVTGTLPIANGGIGLTSLADGSIVVGDGVGDPVSLAAFSSSTGNLLAAKGGTIGQQTIWVPAAAMEPRATTAPATSNVVEIGTSLLALRTMDFATDADDHAGFAIQMPKGWDEGTIIAQFVWSHAATATNFGVAWFIRAGAYGDSDLLTTALGTAVGTVDTGGTTDDVFVSAETAAVTAAGTPAAEDWVYFEVYRDVDHASDNLAIDARLHGVKIHYTIDAGTDD